MTELGGITFALLLSLVGAQLAGRFGYPRVMGQLVISLVLGFSVVRGFLGKDILTVIKPLSALGAIFLLLLTGFGINIEEFKKCGRDSVAITIFSVGVSFMLGFFLALLAGKTPVAGLVLAACLSITAEGTTVALLMEMGKLKTRLANIMLGAGVIDDVFEVFFLALILFFVAD